MSILSVTDQWAIIGIAGPKSRILVGRIVDDIDMSNESMPHMSVREGTLLGGIPCRIFRVSFSGELMFELNVPSGYGLHVWEQTMAIGSDLDIIPYGTETMHLLRAEKGFIIVGQETDGTVTPRDLNMEHLISKKKDFIGKRSLLRKSMSGSNRKKLVGLLSENPKQVLAEGSQIIDVNVSLKAPVTMLGHVTSSYYSPNLNRSIALGLLREDSIHNNPVVGIYADGKKLRAKVVDPVFYDRTGAKMRA